MKKLARFLYPGIFISSGLWFVAASIIRINFMLSGRQDVDALPFISVVVAIVFLSVAFTQLMEIQALRAELERARIRQEVKEEQYR